MKSLSIRLKKCALKEAAVWEASTASIVELASFNRQAFQNASLLATMLAIRRALACEPSVDELIANRHKIKHDMDDWS